MSEPSLSPELKKQTTKKYMRKIRQISIQDNTIYLTSPGKTVKITKIEVWETDIAKRRLRTHDNWMWGMILSEIWEQKEDMN